MRLSEIPFDLSYTFDANLRDVPTSPREMEAAVAFLVERLHSGDLKDGEVAQALGHIGVFCRIIGRLDEARDYLERAIALSQEAGDARGKLVITLRLSHIHQWQREFTTADALFSDSLARCESDPALNGLADFAYQHCGKSLFDQRWYAEAAKMFGVALAIRVEKWDAELVESSQLALEAAHSRLKSDL